MNPVGPAVHKTVAPRCRCRARAGGNSLWRRRRRGRGEVVEAVFAGDDDEMGDPAAEAHPHDDGVAAGEIGIDEMVGGQVFVDVPDTLRRPPGGAVPVTPATLGVAAYGGEEPI